MKNLKILELAGAMKQITGLRGVKFNYAIAKNINTLQKEVESLMKASEPSEDFKAHEAKRIELCKEHSRKDEEGEAIMIHDGKEYDILDRVAFDKELDKLIEENQEAIDAYRKQMSDFKELLEQETEVSLIKIKLSDVPEEILTEQLTGIYELIEE